MTKPASPPPAHEPDMWYEVAAPERTLANMYEAFLIAAETTPDIPDFNAHTDRFLPEQRLGFGRADLLILHAVGSVTVIEAKHGMYGVTHVCQGIGQAILYATQIRLKVARVQKALLWTTTGDSVADLMIVRACEEGGVTSIQMPTPEGRS